MSAVAHEISRTFADSGLTLCRVLAEMLDEDFKHHTARRGCGYTQATRFLSSYINQPRDPLLVTDLGIFEDFSPREAEVVAHFAHAAGWAYGWRALDEAPTALIDALPSSTMLQRLRRLPVELRYLQAQQAYPESRLFVQLLEHTLTGRSPGAPDVPGMPLKPDIGSCTLAEEFFLELAHHRVRRQGNVNIIVDAHGAPLLVEKMNLGESHSAIVVAPIRINGVLLPPGSLCALHYPEDVSGVPSRHGQALPVSIIEQARFLRLTTLAVDPQDRRRAFSVQVVAQTNADFFSPLLTTIAQLRAFALDELKPA